MAKLIHLGIMSLDGYIADRDGNFDFAEPDEAVHAFVNDLARPVGTHLYGRRNYELMIGWETDPSLADQSDQMRDFAEIWKAADKIVYSTTLDEVSTTRTRLERAFDPEAVRRLKETADADILIAGPNLAACATRVGLVDEYHLFLNPVVLGGGTRYLPDDVRIDLELIDEHRFAGGVVFLRYSTVKSRS